MSDAQAPLNLPPAPDDGASQILGVKVEGTPKSFGKPTRAVFNRRRTLAGLGGTAALAGSLLSPGLGTGAPKAGALTTSDLTTLPFTGKFREVCKTAMLDLAPTPFASVADLRRTLAADATMLSSHPTIKNPETPRLSDEQRVVTVTANLIAFKFESHAASAAGDNDFHVIIGDATVTPDTVMNVEVSGLPKAGDPSGRFQAVREKFLSIVSQAGLTPKTAFQEPEQTVRVRVTGSLYFDADHKAGQVGPAGSRPSTVWEIHPVQDIEVLPAGSGGSDGS